MRKRRIRDGERGGPGCPVTYPVKFMVPLLPGFTMSMSSASQMGISQ